jgi:hypothetical protein
VNDAVVARDALERHGLYLTHKAFLLELNLTLLLSIKFQTNFNARKDWVLHPPALYVLSAV